MSRELSSRAFGPNDLTDTTIRGVDAFLWDFCVASSFLAFQTRWLATFLNATSGACKSAPVFVEWSQQLVFGLACLFGRSLQSFKVRGSKSRWSHSYSRRHAVLGNLSDRACVRMSSAITAALICVPWWAFFGRPFGNDSGPFRVPIRLVFQHRPGDHRNLAGHSQSDPHHPAPPRSLRPSCARLRGWFVRAGCVRLLWRSRPNGVPHQPVGRPVNRVASTRRRVGLATVPPENIRRVAVDAN